MPDPVFPPLFAPLARRNAHVHDPSTLVRCGAYWYVFATGQGISTWRSRDLMTWERGPSVFPSVNSCPAWWESVVPGFNGKCWAPDVIRVNQQYLLYYSISAWGKRTSAIGLATSPTLDPADKSYRWTDKGIVVQTGDTSDHNAIDPSVCRDARTGQLWLGYGSFWSGIKGVALDPKTGLREPAGAPPIPLAWNSTIEAACLVQKNRWWFLFVNWGWCCRGKNSTYEIRVGRSETALGPFRDKEGKDLLKGGGSLFLGGNAANGAFIGPGHAGIFLSKGVDFLSCHFYDGDNNGTPTLGILPLEWDKNGWPEVTPPTMQKAP